MTDSALPDSKPAQVYLLHLLRSVTSGKLTRGDLNQKAKTKVAQGVGVNQQTLSALLEQLRNDQLLSETKVGRSLVYSLTEAGQRFLEGAQDLLPAQSGRASRSAVRPAANEQVRLYRNSLLLLQVFKAPHATLTETDANTQLDRYAREALELNGATATALRQEMVERGLLVATGTGKARTYRITPEGRLEVGNLKLDPDRNVTLTGQVVNDLLEAAREVAKQFAPAEKRPTSPVPFDLNKTLLALFEELLSGRYRAERLVPIPELRQLVRTRLGEDRASREVFDQGVLDLWRAGEIRLISIGDASKATPEQIRDAIPGVGETLFYLEPAREYAHA